MTRDEIKNTPELVDYLLDESVIADSRKKLRKRMDEICNLAIKALEQEPILDKIKTEILEEKDCAYADFERYKVEYLGQDWEEVYDSLPQDDFRYGMERCIDIIDKYKAESEKE